MATFEGMHKVEAKALKSRVVVSADGPNSTLLCFLEEDEAKKLLEQLQESLVEVYKYKDRVDFDAYGSEAAIEIDKWPQWKKDIFNIKIEKKEVKPKKVVKRRLLK